MSQPTKRSEYHSKGSQSTKTFTFGGDPLPRLFCFITLSLSHTVTTTESNEAQLGTRTRHRTTMISLKHLSEFRVPATKRALGRIGKGTTTATIHAFGVQSIDRHVNCSTTVLSFDMLCLCGIVQTDCEHSLLVIVVLSIA